jgi:hypothetical protein
MTWEAKFSDQKYVQRGAQRSSDLGTDRYAAPRQRENHDGIATLEMAKSRGQLGSSVASIAVGLI